MDPAASTATAAVAHFDVAGPDEAALHRFYAGVLGWAVDVRGPGYALVRTPAGSPDGAIVEADAPSLTLGIAVADLDAALAAAERAGGAVTMPATDNGWVVKAQVTDPAGNPLTLIQR
jgi:predicted enzyme related to lactoylglutathione lyase